jgi:hypothetical protein
MRNDEARMTNAEGMIFALPFCFFIRASSLFRHFSFVIRHFYVHAQ